MPTRIDGVRCISRCISLSYFILFPPPHVAHQHPLVWAEELDAKAFPIHPAAYCVVHIVGAIGSVH